MRDLSRSGDIGRRAHPGLVTEQSPFNALHQRRTDASAQRLLPTEGIRYDQLDDPDEMPGVEQYDPQCQHDIPERHHRNDHAAYARDLADSAEDDPQGQQRQHDAHHRGIETESSFPGRTNGVALHRIECEAERHRNQHREAESHPAQAQPLLHVVSRAADIGIAAAALVQLG